MNENTFLDMVAEIFEIEKSTIHIETTQEDLPEWDSFAHLNLFMKASEVFGKELDPDKIADLLTLKEIYDFFKLA